MWVYIVYNLELMKNKQRGAAEARRAHNPEDLRSKRSVAKFLLSTFWFKYNLEGHGDE